MSNSPPLRNDSSTTKPPSRAQRIARAKAVFQATILDNQLFPEQLKYTLTPKQVEFLCYEGREALFGGAAGGGKSVAILAAALQYVEEPTYHALILRRTYKQLAKADSILGKAKEWLHGKAKWNGDDFKFTFPSGATLEFGHMDHEDSKLNYQGGSWQFVGVDEATQFTEEMIAYPRSRLRRVAGSQIPIRWRGASNPGGIGHDHIKGRYVKDKDGRDPSTPQRQFFPAKLDDNPHIDRAEYIATLLDSGIDELTLAQLLKGDWDAVTGGRFLRTWLQLEWSARGDYLLLHKPAGDVVFLRRSCLIFCTVDPASSTSKAADYTVISTWLISPQGDLVWLDCVRVKLQIPDVIPEIQKAVVKHKPAWVGIEAIASNVGVYQLALRAVNPVILARPLNKANQDKLVHATPAITFVSNGKLYFPRPSAEPRFPLAEVIAELTRFTGNDKLDDHDDVVDTLSYAVEFLRDAPSPEARSAVPRVIGG